MSATTLRPPPRTRRLRVGQWLSLTIGVLLAFAVGGIGLSLIVNQRLSDRRHLVLEEVEPALRAALKLESALVDEETGVRGFVITAEPRFLEPYESGRVAEDEAYRELARLRQASGSLEVAIAAVHARAEAWRAQFASPALLHARTSHSGSVAASLRGKSLFDAIRASLDHLHAALSARLTQTRRQLLDEASVLESTLIVAGLLIVGSVLGAGLLMRRIITRPVALLRQEANTVAGGDFTKTLAITSGAREIVDLSEEMDAMRQRILHELTAVESARERLEEQAAELHRSNAELEQFAYVASHDLQEPLRKVASFCQALERRYHGQLDERADQYIEFAVDGAKRMQILINDLLAFSRVGRSGREHQPVDLNDVVAEAQASLSNAIEDGHGRVEVEVVLPVINGDRTLLVSLFQNLIANALKFHGEQPPVVQLSALREGDVWHLICGDNGIGIDPEYAERIFVIFQRLHTKEAYPGTGIGLAMCRKIVEHHGGRMWLDPEPGSGARFHITLPIREGSRS